MYPIEPGTNLPLGVGGTKSGQTRSANLRNSIDKLLGNDIQLSPTRAVDLDKTYQSAPHAAMGLGLAVSGRATIGPFLLNLYQFRLKRIFSQLTRLHSERGRGEPLGGIPGPNQVSSRRRASP
jgi:hypothetical protein